MQKINNQSHKKTNSVSSSIKTAKINPPISPAHSSWSTSKAVLIMGSLLAISLLALTFIGGFATGKHSGAKKIQQAEFAKRQLTENLDRPIKDRPLLNKAADKIKGQLKEHGVSGTIVELDKNALVIDTPQGPRSVLINDQTKIVEGKQQKKISHEQLKTGQKVLVLGSPGQDHDNNSDSLTAKVIIIGGTGAQPRPRGQ